MPKPTTRLSVAALVCLCGPSAFGILASPPPPDVPPASSPTPPTSIDSQLLSLISVDRLRDTHIALAQENHIAGTPGDARTIERIAAMFTQAGLEVQVHDIYPLLCRPISASLAITSPDQLALDLSERTLPEDKDSTPATFAWNAYSASGEVEAGVVYANYGTKEDFARLRELGIDCTDKIVLARYGGNYRGYKVKFAQQAHAAAVLIFTDPADSGFTKGPVYPEGGYANDCCIQRGSILTLSHQGDPLTPGREATKDANRDVEREVTLPRIPCQPIGYGAAKEILSRMKGEEAPKEWQGGLGFAYRLQSEQIPSSQAPAVPSETTPEKPLSIKLAVKQERAVMHTANVIATLRGTHFPEQLVIMGAHHDAWNHGAADPLCGTITVIESARILAQLAKEGQRPKRSIVFAAWAAEEFGIIGSTEWVESRRAELMKNAVAYINLDMASMGLEFGASALPSLRTVIAAAAGEVPQPGNPASTVLAAWAKRSPDPRNPNLPSFGDIGGGSDHVAFLCYAGVASCGFGSGGSKGNSYHSAYDTLMWYWKVMGAEAGRGAEYESAKMVSSVTALTAAKLAFASVPPLDPTAYDADIRKQITALSKLASNRKLIEPFEGDTAPIFAPVLEAAGRFRTFAAGLVEQANNSGPLTTEAARSLTQQLLACDRQWLNEAGLPGRPWYKNDYAAPDEDSGYAAWPLPRIRKAIEDGNVPQLNAAIADLAARLEKAAQAK